MVMGDGGGREEGGGGRRREEEGVESQYCSISPGR